MNTLAYGLLGLVARTPSSGYDLMLQLQPYWQAKHSQIYPLLAKLEQDGYLQLTRVHQTDRPDKKVYSITEKGEIALKLWLAEPTAEPVVRDELVLKACCLPFTDLKASRARKEIRIDPINTALPFTCRGGWRVFSSQASAAAFRLDTFLLY